MTSNKKFIETESMYGSSLPLDSVKVIAETIGISNFPDDAAKELAEDISYRLKHIIQDAAKFMHHSKRSKLLNSDVDHSLKTKNIEPLYGFYANDHIPFRFASGGGRELFFLEEKEVDLNELVNTQPIKLPIDISIRAHWLAIEGTQPTVPENPPPVSKDLQKLEAVDPMNKLNKFTEDKGTLAGKPAAKVQKLRNVETVHVKQLATHELSVEQQLYYKEITEACVGSDEARRAEALQSLSSDPGLHEMLPRMCTFIAEGVKVNVVQHNLALLIYLMRMVKALLENPSLYLEKYLHELIPSVLTCVVSKQLCMRPELDNHWALRDFASRLMAQICKSFNTSTNNLQTRITRLFCTAISDENTHLSSLYGALQGLSELGFEVSKVFILPKAKLIADKLESNSDKMSLGHVKHLLVKILTPIIKSVRPGPDILEEYKTDFGCLGASLHSAVFKARLSTTTPILSNTNQPSFIQTTTSGDIILNQGLPINSPARTIMVSNIQKPTVIPVTNSQQKYVILSTRQQQSNATTSQNSAMPFRFPYITPIYQIPQLQIPSSTSSIFNSNNNLWCNKIYKNKFT